MVDTSCMSLDHITTSTCFPEPATSSGHLGLLHLGDESVIRPLTCVLPHHCQHLPSPTATSSTSTTPRLSTPCQLSVAALSPTSQRLPASTSIYLQVPASISVYFRVPSSRVLVTLSPHQFFASYPPRFRIPPRVPSYFYPRNMPSSTKKRTAAKKQQPQQQRQPLSAPSPFAPATTTISSAWKSGPKTAKKPRPNQTQTAQDRKFPGPSKTATAVRSSVSQDS